jgi:RNA polymerase sigma factor (sigma-70 family)
MRQQEIKAIYLKQKPIFMRAFRKERLSKDSLQDLYHEGFQAWLEAVEAGRFDRSKEAGAYIYRAAKNIYLRKREKAQREAQWDAPLLELAWKDFPEKGRERKEMINWVKENLPRILSAEECQILTYFGFDKLPNQDMAERLGISEDNVKTKKRRALQKVRKAMRVAFDLPQKRMEK